MARLQCMRGLQWWGLAPEETSNFQIALQLQLSHQFLSGRSKLLQKLFYIFSSLLQSSVAAAHLCAVVIAEAGQIVLKAFDTNIARFPKLKPNRHYAGIWKLKHRNLVKAADDVLQFGPAVVFIEHFNSIVNVSTLCYLRQLAECFGSKKSEGIELLNLFHDRKFLVTRFLPCDLARLFSGGFVLTIGNSNCDEQGNETAQSLSPARKMLMGFKPTNESRHVVDTSCANAQHVGRYCV